MYHFTDGGLRNVWLRNGYVQHTTPYGKGVSFDDLDGLTSTICSALAQKPGKLTGAEFRYLRNAMLLSQKSLGEMLGYSEQAVAKWEKSGKIPKVVESVVRSIYQAKQNGHAKINSIIDTLNLIERVAASKIILSETRHRWHAEIQAADELSKSR